MANKIVYNDETHTYTRDGEVLKTVTEIASEVCKINKNFFSAQAAATGTDIHTELARYYDPKDSFCADDFTIEKAAQMALFLKRAPSFLTEVIVYNNQFGYAGTVDLVSIVGNKVKMIVDFKSGRVNRKYCTVQLSLYKLALEDMGYDCSEALCRVISPLGITNIEPLDWADVWDLAPSLLDYESEELNILEDTLKELRPAYEEYKRVEEQFRAKIQKQLESSGATKYSGYVFDVSYVAPSVRVGLDTTRLKAEQPEIYASYLKETKVSATVKLQTKTNEQKEN